MVDVAVLIISYFVAKPPSLSVSSALGLVDLQMLRCYLVSSR